MPLSHSATEITRNRVTAFIERRQKFIESVDPVAFPSTEDTTPEDHLQSAQLCLDAYRQWANGERGEPPVFFDAACLGCGGFSAFCAAARLAEFASPILNFRTFHDHLFGSDRSGYQPTSGMIIAMRATGWWSSFHSHLRVVFEYSDLAMDELTTMAEGRGTAKNYLDFHEQDRLQLSVEALIEQVRSLI